MPAGRSGTHAGPGREANLLLLEVRLGDQVLSDAVTAYQFGRDVFLPLGETGAPADPGGRVTPGEGRASGYILTEQRNFSLDVPGARSRSPAAAKSSTVPGQAAGRGDLRRQPAAGALAAGRPRRRHVQPGLKVRPREQLPLQARLARRERGNLPGSPAAISIPAIRAWPRPTGWPASPSSTRRWPSTERQPSNRPAAPRPTRPTPPT
jgi:hypothetical protein